METQQATQVIRALAAEAPMNWDNRTQAIDAVKHIESELSVLADLRAVQGKNKAKSEKQAQAQF